MPVELNDPEGMFPFHYDPRYDQAPNPFEPGAVDINGYLQGIAVEVSGKELGKEQLKNLKESLENKDMFHRNIGDESFRTEAGKMVKRLLMAGKVAEKCLKI
jgi:hypothetical protein